MSRGKFLRKPPEGGKIEKPEDKPWKDQYNKLGVEEHEKYLHQLGLDNQEIEEWEEAVGLKKQPKKKK